MEKEKVEKEKVEKEKVEKSDEVVSTKLGTAGLVLGIIAIATSMIPIVNTISFILGILALIFGIIAVVKDTKKVKSIITIVLAVIAMLVVIIMQVSIAKSLNELFSGSEFEQKEGDGIITDIKSEPEKKEFKVGEVAENNSLIIKFLSQNLDFKDYNRYATVKAGYKILKAEFEFENKATSDDHVSDWNFECYADGYSCDTFYSVDDSGFSATLPIPGRTLKTRIQLRNKN